MDEQRAENLITALTISKRLSLSKRAVFRMRNARLICSSIQVGAGTIRWRQSDIDQWIAWGCPSQSEFEARMEERIAKHRQEGQV